MNYPQQDDRLWLSPEAKPRIKADKDVPGSKDVPSNLSKHLNDKVAINDGYKVTIRRSQTVSCGMRHDIKCIRGRCASRGSGKKNETNTGLSQVESEICHFFVPIYFDTTVGLFFFKQHCHPVFAHCGHPKTNREHMRLGASDIPDNVRAVAEQMLGKNCPNPVVQLLLSVMSGDRITQDSMSKMRRAVLVSKHDSNSDESTADTLLKMLKEKEKEGVVFCYMTGSYDEALGKVRVRKGAYLRKCAFAFLRLYNTIPPCPNMSIFSSF